MSESARPTVGELAVIVAGLQKSMDEMKRFLAAAVALMVTVAVSAIGWGVSQAYTAERAALERDQADAKNQSAQMAMLQSQVAALAAANKPQSVVVNQPSAGGSTSSTP